MSDTFKIVKETFHKYQSVFVLSIIGATLFLVSLAWNDVAQEAIAVYFPKESRNSIMGKLYYAIIITIIVVLIQTHIFPYISEKK